MTLTEEQKTTLGDWVEAGADLGEIQNRLKDEFGLNLTFLDTRFLLGDLGLELLSDREEPEEEEAPAEENSPPADDSPPPTDDESGQPEQSGETDDVPPDPDEVSPEGGKLDLTVDALTLPGAVVSGKVTFSDGETAAWYLDQMGRLGLDASTPDYQPSPEDVAAFQVELQNVLRKQGF